MSRIRLYVALESNVSMTVADFLRRAPPGGEEQSTYSNSLKLRPTTSSGIPSKVASGRKLVKTVSWLTAETFSSWKENHGL